MANESHHSKFHDDLEFQSLLVSCLEAVQGGQQIDIEAIANDHPRYADEIRRFLNDRATLEAFANEFKTEVVPQKDLSAYERTVDSRAAAADWSPGDNIRYIGEYEILEEIARGGMGIVFRARQAQLGRIVALKMILAGKLADDADVERFRREAKAAAQLKHPNIVPVHEIGEHEGRHYFTMDFIDGQSLAEMIREEIFSPRDASELLRKVAMAVHFAHEQGTIHRDLKPANVLVSAENTPHVTDFGLAKMLEPVGADSGAELTATGQILGTRSYMSPEQAAGDQELVGTASDIHSLGAILYATLVGRAPFAADSPIDTLMQVMKKEPVAIRDLNPSVPKDLETVCLKCLSKEPQKRYGTAAEFADDLSRFLEDRPVKARPVGPAQKLIRWSRRNSAIASLIALSAVLLVTGTVLSSYFAVQASRRATAEAEAHALAEEALENEQLATELAQSERDRARTQTQRAEVVLSRSLLEQARSVRLARSEGYRWKAQDLLLESEALSRSYRNASGLADEVKAGLPSRSDLRTELLATLLGNDGRLADSRPALYQVVDPSSTFVGLLEVTSIPPAPTLKVFELGNRREVAKLNLKDFAREMATPSFAISPDGRIAANFYLTEIRLTQLSSGNVIASLIWPRVDEDSDRRTPVASLQGHLEFSADGKYLTAFRARSGNAESALWEIPDNMDSMRESEAPLEIRGELLAKARPSIFGRPGFSPDSKRLAYPEGNHRIIVVNVEDRSRWAEFEVQEPWSLFGPMAFSPKGDSITFVAVREQPRNSSLVVWDFAEKTETHRIVTGTKIWFAPPAMSPNGRFVAAGTPEGDIEIYDLSADEAVLKLKHGGAIRDLGWIGDHRLWSTAAGAMKQWSLSLERPLRTLKTASLGRFPSIRIAFTPDGNRLVVNLGRSKMYVYSWPDATLEQTIDMPMRSAIKVNSSADGNNLVVTGMQDPTRSGAPLAAAGVLPTTVAAFELSSGEELFNYSHPGSQSAAIAENGKVLLLRKDRHKLSFEDAESKREIWSKEFDVSPGSEPVGAIHPKATRIATWVTSLLPGPKNRMLEVWEPATNRLVFRVDEPQDYIVSAQFTRDGINLLTTHTQNLMSTFGQSTADVKGSARVRDGESGELLLEVIGSQVLAAALSDDSTLLAVQFPNQRIELWDVYAAEKLLDWQLPNSTSTQMAKVDLAFTPDGQHLAAVNGSEGAIEILQLRDLRAYLKPYQLQW